MPYVAPPPVSSLTRSTTVARPGRSGSTVVAPNAAATSRRLASGSTAIDRLDALGRGGRDRREPDRTRRRTRPGCRPSPGLSTLSTVPAPVWKPQPYGASQGQVELWVDHDAVVGVRERVLRRGWTGRRTLPNTGLPSRGVGVRAVHPHAHVVEQQGLVAVARPGPARHLRAVAAGAEAHHHVVAGLDARDVRADLLDDARALVAEDVGEHLRRQEVPMVMSVWHSPVATIRTSTSSSRGSSSSTSASVNGWP